ncbi:hypothetical protein BD309DRAFT_857400 [Dichomitus squalens]|uniref:Uncharacterized protein n=1 Tax=Dichomitus squalens TaxID=114155 RepID=A0A4Q9Q036_9APHY|nr:hypothetical protein BD311DRAFT_659012 [Dichomitus squalens]TBU46776.1 hypothetical protein BD309DRAFT_857400 [Dichomitus squalens]TBU60487.1 hypothetical protein BD310DRAFT_815025 [Dichomitus squalens]
MRSDVRKNSCRVCRICPGRHFAEASLMIYCASVLHVFDIQPPLDIRGAPVKMKYRASDDMISCVPPRLTLYAILTQ